MGLRFLTLDAQTQRFLEAAVADPAPRTVASAAAPYRRRPGGLHPSSDGLARQAAAPKLVAPPALATPSPSGVTVGAPVPSAPRLRDQPRSRPSARAPSSASTWGPPTRAPPYVKANKPGVLPSREGYNTVPSILALNTRGKLVVGHPAKSQMLTNPRQTVYGAKRLVGRSFDSPVVQQIKRPLRL